MKNKNKLIRKHIVHRSRSSASAARESFRGESVKMFPEIDDKVFI